MFDNLEELNILSDKEKEVALKILEEYSKSGKSSLYNKLLLDDYKELPVDIITFIKDYNYLGKAWHTSSGRCKLYPYWEDKLKELFPDPYTTNFNNFIESGARGIGKAQPLDSLVFTSTGYKRMGDIQVGEDIYGSDGLCHKVTHVFPQGIKKVCRVTFNDETSTLCCDEHLWTVFDERYTNQKTLTCKDLLNQGLKTSIDDKYRFRIPIVEPLQFENKEVEILPIIMGYVIGRCSLKIPFNKNIIEDFLSYFLISSEKELDAVYEKFLRKGFRDNQLYNNSVDKIYLYNSTENRINFLVGFLMAVDFNPLEKRLYIFDNKKLAEDITFLIQSLGGLCNCRCYDKSSSVDAYELYIQLPDYIKNKSSNHTESNLKKYITSIEYVEEQECQCIIIDSEDHLYLTNDLIVTHNSEIAVTIGLYLMHRLMCLKNPHEYLDLKPTEKVAFAFMNITITLAEEIGISKFQETVKMSPWFMDRGQVTGRDIKIWNPPEFIDIIIGSQSSHIIGRPIYFAFFDEISFIKNQDIDKQKKIAMDMIDTAIAGMKTRFIHKGKNPTLLCLASSKRTEKSFLEEHMKKKLEEEDETALIIDEPIWNIKPADSYSGRKFYVAQGNRFLNSEIIPDGENIKIWKDKGYRVLEVPIEFKSDFRDDIDRALCDFAGISSSQLTKYISGARLEAIRSKDYLNPFVKNVIEVGNATTDTAQYSDFFDLSRIQEKYMDRPLFVHLDMSLTGDKTGIAGVWVVGKKLIADSNSSAEELYFRLAFSTSIKAPKGYQISFAKNRQFIYWLREKGFNLRGVTTDTYQNASLAQDLLAKNYPYEVLSVDRVDPQSRICAPYAYFKNCIYEQRLTIFDNETLTEEILCLERNNNTGKIDHPDGQAKDQSDAVCGALYNASKHADEFAFFYGEDIDNTISASSQSSYSDKKQIEIDMQEELNRLFDPLNSQKEKLQKENDSFIDFGLGRASSNYSAIYMQQGIII